eukprot:4868961-Prymnesium_polylepis.1
MSAASHSAWDGGRVSTAAPGQHDLTSGVWEPLAPSGGLLAAVRRVPVSRLFVMGLDTEFAVRTTVLDALG